MGTPASIQLAVGANSYVVSVLGRPVGTTRIVLPWPPSENTRLTRANGRFVLSAGHRRYKSHASLLGRGQIRFGPTDGVVCLSLRFVPPDHALRDEDNYVKAVKDVLASCGLYGDDRQVVGTSTVMVAPEAPGRVEVEAWWWDKGIDEWKRLTRP